MSEPYTPDTEAVRLAYVDRRDFIAQLARTERKDDSEYGAAFDRWLDQVLAEARREGQAEAWGEGYRAGAEDMSDLRAGKLTFQTITSNPYETGGRHVDQ